MTEQIVEKHFLKVRIQVVPIPEMLRLKVRYNPPSTSLLYFGFLAQAKGGKEEKEGEK